MNKYACVVCSMPAPGIPYDVHYGPGEIPPIRGQVYLCEPHASVLVTSERPLVPATTPISEPVGWTP